MVLALVIIVREYRKFKIKIYIDIDLSTPGAAELLQTIRVDTISSSTLIDFYIQQNTPSFILYLRSNR